MKNFKSNLLKTIAIICTVFVASCNDTTIDAPVVEPKLSIMPLKTGNTWNYKVFYIDLVSGAREDADKDFTTTIGAESTIDGESWFAVNNFVDKKGDGPLLNFKNGGLWVGGYNAQGMLEQALFYKYPASANSTYDNPGGTWTIASTSATVVAGGTTYTCYHYKAPNFSEENSEMNLYVAPGVGLIKSVYTSTQEKKVYDVSLELQSYNLR